MSAVSGRVRRRHPRPASVLAPERDQVTGRYQGASQHDQKGRQQPQSRRHMAARRRVGLAAAAGAIVGGLAVVAVVRGGDQSSAPEVVNTDSVVPSTTSLTAGSTAANSTATSEPGVVSTTAGATASAVAPPSELEAFVGNYIADVTPDVLPYGGPLGRTFLIELACDTGTCTLTSPEYEQITVTGDVITLEGPFGFIPCASDPAIQTYWQVTAVLTVTDRDPAGRVMGLEGHVDEIGQTAGCPKVRVIDGGGTWTVRRQGG
jgi:hypothetical protein